MRTLFFTIPVFLAAVGFQSCSDSGPIAPPDLAKLKNVQWRLITSDSLGGRTITLSSVDTIVLFFEETRIVRGTSHGRCANYCSGVYTSSPTGTFRIDSLSSTEMACPSSRYREFFNELSEVSSFAINGNDLYLYIGGSMRKMAFERMVSFAQE